MFNKNRTYWMVLLIALPVVIIFSTGIGAFNIPPLNVLAALVHSIGIDSGIEVSQAQENVLLQIRLPRVLMAVIVGAALSVSGAGMQGLFRNPLADPGLVGISSGAVLGAALVIVLGWQASEGLLGFYGLSVATFIGAVLCTLVVFRLASTKGRAQVTTMLLAGIAINALVGAVTGLLIYTADDDELRSLTFWTLGSLGGANWTTFLGMLPLIIIPTIQILRLSKKLDVFSLGEESAQCMGVDVQSLKRHLIIWVTIAVGSSVAVVGMIGFVGLVVPHLVRLIFGANHRFVVMGSVLLGAILLTLADLLSRVVVMPSELPIGIITAMLGTPLFIMLLLQQRRREGRYV